MRQAIYQRLIAADGFVSGGQLGEAFGVTRAALWKHIKAFEADGALVESVTGKGYRLVQPPRLPRAAYVRAHLHRDIPVFFEMSATSTNDMAKAAAQDSALQFAAFIAGEQTAGRGRKGRTWVSKPGQGVFITMLVRPKVEPQHVSGITLMAAVAVCEAIEQTTNVRACIKWPNDIILGGKKAAGILTESMMHMDGIDFAVCGIGINTDAATLNPDLTQTACAVIANNTLLAAAVIDRFADAYAVFEQSGVASFMPAFRERSAISGNVTLQTAQGIVAGKLLGFDDTGAILIKTGSDTQRFVAGEISLRGEKGYV